MLELDATTSRQSGLQALNPSPPGYTAWVPVTKEFTSSARENQSDSTDTVANVPGTEWAMLRKAS